MGNEPVQIYEARNSLEASLVVQRLGDAGIEARVESSAIESVVGEVPFQLAGVPIWVDRADVERAQEVVRDLPPNRR